MAKPILNKKSISDLYDKIQDIVNGSSEISSTMSRISSGLTKNEDEARDLQMAIYENLAIALHNRLLVNGTLSREDYGIMAGYAVGAERDYFFSAVLQDLPTSDGVPDHIKFEKEIAFPIAQGLMSYFDAAVEIQSKIPPHSRGVPENN